VARRRTNGPFDAFYMQLDRLRRLPPELATVEVRSIQSVLPHPTLIELEGRRGPPLFLSTLLHGNELTSFHVLQELARRYADAPPPRSLLIFVGNVDAAAAGARRLPQQEDFNRIWAGGVGEPFDLAREVTASARAAQPFASVDIHNNTGANPFYGCANTLQSTTLSLAALFSRIAVLYRNPPTTQSMAFMQFCPAVAIECGQIGNVAGTARAIAFIDTLLHLDHLPPRAPPAHDLSLYETIGRVLVDDACSFTFADEDCDLQLRPDLEQKNFSEMTEGEVWGRARCAHMPLRVLDENDRDLTTDFFERRGDWIQLRKPSVPAMLTSQREIIRQDCLGYLMQTLSLPH